MLQLFLKLGSNSRKSMIVVGFTVSMAFSKAINFFSIVLAVPIKYAEAIFVRLKPLSRCERSILEANISKIRF